MPALAVSGLDRCLVPTSGPTRCKPLREPFGGTCVPATSGYSKTKMTPPAASCLLAFSSPSLRVPHAAQVPLCLHLYRRRLTGTKFSAAKLSPPPQPSARQAHAHGRRPLIATVARASDATTVPSPWCAVVAALTTSPPPTDVAAASTMACGFSPPPPASQPVRSVGQRDTTRSSTYLADTTTPRHLAHRNPVAAAGISRAGCLLADVRVSSAEGVRRWRAWAPRRSCRGFAPILFPPTTCRQFPFPTTRLLSGATRALQRRRRRHRPPSPLVITMKAHRQHEAANMTTANRQSSWGTQGSDIPAVTAAGELGYQHPP